jgi:hypothetical protein
MIPRPGALSLLRLIARTTLALASTFCVTRPTGRPTGPGEYASCDRTYAELLHKLRHDRFAGVTPALGDDLLNFYSNSADDTMRRKHRRWRGVLRDRDELEAASALPEPHPVTTANACAATPP